MFKQKRLPLLALFVMLSLLLLAASVPAFPRVSAAGDGQSSSLVPLQKPVLVNGRELNLTQWRLDGVTLVPVRTLSYALQARVDWDPATRTVTVVKDGAAIKLEVDSGRAYKNDRPIEPGGRVILLENRVLVPLRFIARTLGATVQWNEKTGVIEITMPEQGGPDNAVPAEVYSTTIPSRVAFTRDGYLWVVDGQGNNSPAKAIPVRDTNGKAVKIVGWSPDGRWLAYLQWDTAEFYSGKPYLWVVKADGTGNFQVDPRPVLDAAAWSPRDNVLAYSTQGPGGGYAPDGNLKLASLNDGKAAITTLLPDKTGLIADFAWAPDGQSLAVSFARTEGNPLQIDRVTLQGERSGLLKLGEPLTEKDQDSIYAWSAEGLKWSPNGRYLAYYLRPNSASLSADGVTLQVLDVQKPGQPLNVGTALNYPQWLAWSPDGSRLACILGGGREATANKHLYIVDMPAGGKIINYGRDGQVDTRPVWTATPPYGLLFCRGPETTAWEGRSDHRGVPVPGQRIWLRAADGTVKPLTGGPADTADYEPHMSLDGKYLIFMRLNQRNSGSLYEMSLDTGELTELCRLSGNPGYYANYYPASFDIQFKESAVREVTGKLTVSNLEGRHYELETAGGRLVLIPREGNKEVAAALEAGVGRQVTVRGFLLDGFSQYMRGPLFKVVQVL
ncbi:MAG TPA: hypothetical protein GXX25_08280 [Desulfotomaculum sp.]|nr:hypothetical protein [Desulfotomaculum sp.]